MIRKLLLVACFVTLLYGMFGNVLLLILAIYMGFLDFRGRGV